MVISLRRTLRAIERCLTEGGEARLPELKRAYDQTLRLQSQLLSVIYDAELFGGIASGAPPQESKAPGQAAAFLSC